MSDIVVQKNIGAYGNLVRLTDVASATAAGAGDATLVTGQAIDRLVIGNGSLPSSALVGVLYEAVLTAGKTLTITPVVQDSGDDSTWAAYNTPTPVVIAAPAGGGTVRGEANFQVDLRAARRYVRLEFTPDLSATATDTATLIGAAFFAGVDTLPASNV